MNSVPFAEGPMCVGHRASMATTISPPLWAPSAPSVRTRRPIARCRDAALVALRDLNLKRTTDRAALLDVFRMIFTGEIRPVEFGSKARLADAMFTAEEVADHLKHGARRDHGPRTKCLGSLAGSRKS